MEYNLKVNEDTVQFKVHVEKEDKICAKIGEKTYNASYAMISDNKIHLSIDNNGSTKGINIYVADDNDAKSIIINGLNYMVQDLDAQTDKSIRKKMATNLPDKITPPMPAVVVSVMVNVDDMVTKGQGIVVVSAMKMETTLVSPFDGKVISVNISEGDKVAPGDILVDIEKIQETKNH